ncbi:MAG TPA: malate synthase A [Jatrophihabitans sp.]|jgi:malate synthase|nr:malate synthase A [Jatrophihabitans sp.]
MNPPTPPGVTLTVPLDENAAELLTHPAVEFLAGLHRRFGQRRIELLRARAQRQAAIDAGALPDFSEETAEIRAGDWTCAPPPPRLEDRRVEITGPTDAKMTINALNSGAKVWLADFEDANTPLWPNLINGQLNLRDAFDGTLRYVGPDGRQYEMVAPDQRPTIVARPRGWHLPEKHLLVDGERVSASLFDFALHVFHCAQRQLDAGAGPYFYLPKMESYLEARLWNDVFVAAEDALGLPGGSIRATVLIETLPAAFQMDEILYELRDHSAGLNAGRWDYLFSTIKTFRSRGRAYVLPDRNQVTMTAPMMRAYTDLLVRTCHRRGVHAVGGMAAFIPNRRDPEVTEAALARVRADKERESADGFDGSWVAHPDLVELCRDTFTAVLGDAPDQRHRMRADVGVTAAQLLDVGSTPGDVTEAGLRANVSVALQYLRSWLAGNGAVAIFNLMEDAATAEICRSQIWQWVRNGVELADGRVLDREFVLAVLDEELAALGEPDAYADARKTFESVALSEDFVDFLTLPAYELMP